jgi:16S rRNA (guanine527-N7)-methyltransferase
MQLRERLKPFEQWLPSLSDNQIVLLDNHLQMLETWNRRINLTAIRDREEAVRRHVAESLFLAAQLPPRELTICDLGSGGGFPGIPTAISRPDCRVTLVESDVRKSVFLREAARALPNIRVSTSRFEDLSGHFDWLISRAVNLSSIERGPIFANAALLTRNMSGPTEGHFQKWKWSSIAIPWPEAGTVLLGTPVNIG